MKRRRKGIIYKTMRFFIAALVLVSAAWFVCCDTAGPGVTPVESFSRIYDQDNDKHFHALDIKQIQDGNDEYIILGMEDQHPYLLKLDSRGEVLNETKEEDFKELAKKKGFADFIEPVREVLVFCDEVDNKYYYYIFCTVVAEEESDLAGISGKSGESRKSALLKLKLSEPIAGSGLDPVFKVEYIEFDHYYGTVKYKGDKFDYTPIVAVKIPGSMNRETQQSEPGDDIIYMEIADITEVSDDSEDKSSETKDVLQIHRIKRSGELKDYELFANLDAKCTREYPIVDRRYHFIRPAEIGGYPGFYIHSYIIPYSVFDYDYPTCFCVYIDTFSALAPPISNRHVYLSSIPCIAFKWDSVNKRASGAHVYDNTVHFFVNCEMEGVDSEEVGPNHEYEYRQVELEVTKPIFLETMELNGKEIVFFAGSAKSNQIVLYSYDGGPPGGRPITKRYFGSGHQYEAAALIKTNDEGLAILGTTYVASRHARICLFKISRSELERMTR